MLVLPNLCQLIFGEPERCPCFGNNFLTDLSLPALELLSMDAGDIYDNLLSFLKWSSPPL
jgi:hypothetical protein